MTLLQLLFLNELVKDPVVCIPSSFFIGVSGVPLEVIAGSLSPDDLMKRINKVKKVNAACEQCHFHLF